MADPRGRFTALWIEHHPTVTAYLRRRLPEAEVDDAVNETFLVAWRRVAEIPDHERPWLLTIANNVASTRMRAVGRQTALRDRVTGALPDHPDSADRAISRLAISNAWAALTEGDREVLALIVWDRLPQKEAAQLLGLSRTAFSVRLVRARRRFAQLLAQNDLQPQGDIAVSRASKPVTRLDRPKPLESISSPTAV